MDTGHRGLDMTRQVREDADLGQIAQESALSSDQAGKQ
jgi:hypothetical protein